MGLLSHKLVDTFCVQVWMNFFAISHLLKGHFILVKSMCVLFEIFELSLRDVGRILPQGMLGSYPQTTRSTNLHSSLILCSRVGT